ncbi:unnamed protein product [Colias eurytheme]|nr:unnamed protein product [Colias eurytheme]
MARWGDERTIQFIHLYREYECLWKPTSSLYKNKIARTNAYRKIQEELNLTEKEIKRPLSLQDSQKPLKENEAPAPATVEPDTVVENLEIQEYKLEDKYGPNTAKKVVTHKKMTKNERSLYQKLGHRARPPSQRWQSQLTTFTERFLSLEEQRIEIDRRYYYRLMEFLYENDINATGTVRMHRVGLPNLIKGVNKMNLKLQKGHFKWRVMTHLLFGRTTKRYCF